MKTTIKIVLEDLTGPLKRPTLKVEMPFAADFDTEFEFINANGDPINLSGWALYLAIRKTPISALPTISRLHISTDVPTGKGKFEITSSDRAVLLRGHYFADIRGEFAGKTHQLTLLDSEANWAVGPAISLPADPITTPTAGTPLAVRPLGNGGYVACNLSGSPVVLVNGAGTSIPASVNPYGPSVWVDVSIDLDAIAPVSGRIDALNAQIAAAAGTLLLARIGPQRDRETDAGSLAPLDLNGQIYVEPYATTTQAGLMLPAYVTVVEEMNAERTGNAGSVAISGSGYQTVFAFTPDVDTVTKLSIQVAARRTSDGLGACWLMDGAIRRGVGAPVFLPSSPFYGYAESEIAGVLAQVLIIGNAVVVQVDPNGNALTASAYIHLTVAS